MVKTVKSYMYQTYFGNIGISKFPVVYEFVCACLLCCALASCPGCTLPNAQIPLGLAQASCDPVKDKQYKRE